MSNRQRRWVSLAVAACALVLGCRSGDEEAAARRCAEAAVLDETDPERALRIRRQVWEELPYTGTRASKECGRQVRERMGGARTLVAHDERGSADAVDGCEWTATAMEVFEGSIKSPYRRHWARRLAERCIHVVGRAWTRDPSSARYARLNERLIELSKSPDED
jgi:hypothetical protein